ncbi:MAG: rubredoxin [Methanomicrobiaceae archaeon]|nr:rubredoxin [Methanomicrobiaceae archaeon]
MKVWKCKKCGYVYNPETGDHESGISKGTAFEDLPETWVCPRCGAKKDKFVAMEI